MPWESIDLPEGEPSPNRWLFPSGTPEYLARQPGDDDGPGGYLQVLGDRRMRRYLVGSLLLLTCGYGSMEAGIPAYITTVAGLPVNAIGVVFFFNTLVIEQILQNSESLDAIHQILAHLRFFRQSDLALFDHFIHGFVDSRLNSELVIKDELPGARTHRLQQISHRSPLFLKKVNIYSTFLP